MSVVHDVGATLTSELQGSLARQIADGDAAADLVLQSQACLKLELQRVTEAAASISALPAVHFSAQQAACLSRINHKLSTVLSTVGAMEHRLAKIKGKLDNSNSAVKLGAEQTKMFTYMR